MCVKEIEAHFDNPESLTLSRWSSHVFSDFHMSVKSSEIPIDRKSEADMPTRHWRSNGIFPPYLRQTKRKKKYACKSDCWKMRSTLWSPALEKKAWMPRHVGQGFPDRSLRSCRFSKDARNPLSLFFFSLICLFAYLLFSFFFPRASTCTQRAASSWPVGSTLLHNPFCWIRLPLF